MVQLRGNLTKKMEDNAGSVRFRRWKAMGWGSRLSLIVLIGQHAHAVAENCQ